MDHSTIEPAIKAIISESQINLAEASRVATAAEACVLAGSTAEAVMVSMDVEQQICALSSCRMPPA